MADGPNFNTEISNDIVTKFQKTEVLKYICTLPHFRKNIYVLYIL